MNNFIKVIFYLSFIGSLVFAQTQLPVKVQSSPDLIQLLNKLLADPSVSRNINNTFSQQLFQQIIELSKKEQGQLIKQPSKVEQIEGYIRSEEPIRSSEPTPAPPIPFPVPIYDENRDDDVLIQVNNLKITKIVPSQTSNVLAYFYVIKDVGWVCNFYGSSTEDRSATSLCPLDIRKPIIQKEIAVRIDTDTILLARNRVKTNISQFKAGDKVNVYGFFDKDNLTFDALVVRKLTESAPVPPISPAPVPPISTSVPVFPVPTTSLPAKEKPFVGYLEKVMPATTLGGNTSSSPFTENLYHLTLDNNLVYSVSPANNQVNDLLDKYSNNRVMIFAFVKREASKFDLGYLIATRVYLIPTEKQPVTSTERGKVNSISGTLTETGISIYMWGTHTLKGDDGRTYLVKGLTNEVTKSLYKYSGKRVKIYAKKVEYKDLEGGFWAIEAEAVLPLK